MKPAAFISANSISLDRLFHQYTDNPALITSCAVLTFKNVEDRLRLVCAHLADAGIRRGNRVAIHEANSEMHLYLFLASWLMDFLYLPLDFKAPLARLLSENSIDFLITQSSVPADAKYIALAPETLLTARQDAKTNVPWPEIPFEQEASVIFTSGSTGIPRGIIHTVGNYLYSAMGTNECIGLNDFDRWILSLPLFHVGGALIWMRTLLAGCACVLPGPAQNLEAAIRQHHPTVISVVPAQLIRLIEKKDLLPVLKGMKTIMLGGAPSPSWLIGKSLDLGLPVMPTYGCTESCAQATGVPKGSVHDAYFTAGRVVAHRNVRIAEDGSILLGGKTLFKRYLDERAGRPFDENGFFKTADSGSLDEEGHLTIHGRTDGIFISGGENISPLEIENQLLACEGIITAIVVPAPHREFGMTPWAFVETTASFNEKDIIDRLRLVLPGYKIPKRVIRLSDDDKKGKMKYSRETLTRLAQALSQKEAPT